MSVSIAGRFVVHEMHPTRLDTCFPAGMTSYLIFVYYDERSRVGTNTTVPYRAMPNHIAILINKQARISTNNIARFNSLA